MKLEYNLKDIIKGGTVYLAGDTIASLISNEFSWLRVFGVLLVGATVYAFEIPNYFRWIDRKVKERKGFKSSMYRAFLAMLYFNPLWIARHLLFIKIFTGAFDQIGWNLLLVGAISFSVIIPISLMANHLIQNKIGFKHRFLASAIFSGIVAIYYSLSDYWFG